MPSVGEHGSKCEVWDKTPGEVSRPSSFSSKIKLCRTYNSRDLENVSSRMSGDMGFKKG